MPITDTDTLCHYDHTSVCGSENVKHTRPLRITNIKCPNAACRADNHCTRPCRLACRQVATCSEWLKWTCRYCSCHHAFTFLTGTSRRDHISPVLRSLHWFPVKQRVDFKLATLVYKSLRSQAPSYLVDDCQLIADSGRPQLRFAHAYVLTVPRTNTRLGDRSFSVGVREFGTVYLPKCGSLTLNLDTLTNFKGISVWQDHGALVTLWFQCAVYKSIYLLTYLLKPWLAGSHTC